MPKSALTATLLRLEDEKADALDDANKAKHIPVAKPAGPHLSTAALMTCGGLSGAIAKTCTAPLGRLTILYQVQALPNHGPGQTIPMRQAFMHVIKTEGVSSLWRGNIATILHRLPYSAANFSTYEVVDHSLQEVIPEEVPRRLIAGGTAGAAGCVAAYPLDLMRARLAATMNTNITMAQAMRHVVQQEGIVGLYRGLGPSLVQVIPSLSIYFTAYHNIKDWGNRVTEGKSPTACTLLAAVSAGVCTSTLTFPLDKCRRIMQVSSAPSAVTSQAGPSAASVSGSHSAVAAARAYTTTSSIRPRYLETIKGIYRQGGFRAFYVGLFADYCKVVPAMTITYVTYEALKAMMVHSERTG